MQTLSARDVWLLRFLTAVLVSLSSSANAHAMPLCPFTDLVCTAYRSACFFTISVTFPCICYLKIFWGEARTRHTKDESSAGRPVPQTRTTPPLTGTRAQASIGSCASPRARAHPKIPPTPLNKTYGRARSG